MEQTIDWESWQYWPYRSSPYWWDYKKRKDPTPPPPPSDPEAFFAAFKNVRPNVDISDLSPDEAPRLVPSGDGLPK